MLRQMESGEPVRLIVSMTTMNGLARLAFIAQQFGYEYADLAQTNDNKFALLVVPDAGPQARERAERNRARYPDAGDGVALPPVEPDAIRLLRARMAVDLGTQYSDRLRMGLAVFFFTASALAIGFRARAHTEVVLVAGVVWAVIMALLPVLMAYSRRYRGNAAAQLEAAGFTAVTDGDGRVRYVPPGGLG
jgi:hypothetical protein